MPEFILNDTRAPIVPLDDFQRGYIEAMFFTNGDTGSDDEWLLNRLGTGRLTRKAIADIQADCEAFNRANRGEIDSASCETGGDYDDEKAGRDFWFSRQGHGVGFADRDIGPAGDMLQDAARAFGEAYVETYRGWIYHR